MDWKEVFRKGQELALATASEDGEPNSNMVISLGFVDDKLLIADCQMDTTIKNLKANKKISIIGKSDGRYLRAKGTVDIYDSGKYFEECKKLTQKYLAKNAVVVNIKEVFDLDKLEQII